jgi:hypothetical protein
MPDGGRFAWTALRRTVLCRTALCALTLGLMTCSKGETAMPDGGAAAAGFTCQQIRMCVLDCADDACVAACAGKGTPAAQADFEPLRACTATTCATGDVNYVNCACNEQCLAGGGCLHEADVCLGAAATDLICDSLCA